MGRHGGGSRSGGRSGGSGRSRGGSRRSGGSSSRISKRPFSGSYSCTYYDRRGRMHTYYTNDSSFGEKSGWNVGIVIILLFLVFHMCGMLSGLVSDIDIISFGKKINGNPERIRITDKADVLTEKEEADVKKLLKDVYDVSGMPVTVYTDDFSWKNKYYDLKVYSEELYYSIGIEEDAMIILFTADNSSDFYDWEYDMYCGDDTIKCLSDPTFDKLLDNFQKGMSGQKLSEALDYAWKSVMNDMAKITINFKALPAIIPIFLFYSIFFVSILRDVKIKNDAYRYYKENNGKTITGASQQTVYYRECPNCGASNSSQLEVCPYCGSLLKVSDENSKYINSNF